MVCMGIYMYTCIYGCEKQGTRIRGCPKILAKPKGFAKIGDVTRELDPPRERMRGARNEPG